MLRVRPHSFFRAPHGRNFEAHVARPKLITSDRYFTLAVPAETPSTAADDPVPESHIVEEVVVVPPVPPASSTSSPGLTSHPPTEDYFGIQELTEELKQGFGQRHEIWFLAQLAITVLVVVAPFQLQGLVDLLGTVVLTAGLVFMVCGLINLGRSTSPFPAPRQQHQLVTSGIYALVRHPMYSGLLMSGAGLAAVTRSETRLVLAAMLWWVLEQKIAIEEAALSEKYPKEYAKYQETVKKLIPFVY